ncbi:hypothetical protein [Mesoplasma seiffertii]|uniref:hypothetical protein n=1 Tax=Mesoplasma seiffertii TaxID=28224 RepID=UPI00047E8481|nr:hypothetical protein [Mesoplasma seiffertii]
MKNIEIIEKELKFLKEEQRYMENKLNILGTVIAATNSLVFIGISSFLNVHNGIYIGVILTLLFPIGCFLLGIFPWNTFPLKKFKNGEENKCNIFSKERIDWDEDNLVEQLNYQKKITLKIIKRKNFWIWSTIIIEFIGVILMLLFLFAF